MTGATVGAATGATAPCATALVALGPLDEAVVNSLEHPCPTREGLRLNRRPTSQRKKRRVASPNGLHFGRRQILRCRNHAIHASAQAAWQRGWVTEIHLSAVWRGHEICQCPG